MTCDHCLEFLAVMAVAVLGHFRRGNQLVGDAAQGANYNYDRPPSGFCLYNLLQA